MGREPYKELDRTSYLRVTECLKPFSGIEFVPAKYLEPAGLRGSLVHYHIENLLSGFETPVDNEEIEPYLNSFARFWQDSLHTFVDSKITLEKRLYCDENKFTGQFDCLIESEDKTYIFDWKTSSKIQSVVWLNQGAAYKYLAEVNGYKNVQDPIFVKLDKFGKEPTLFNCCDYEENLGIFFSCMEIYRHFSMEKRGKYIG